MSLWRKGKTGATVDFKINVEKATSVKLSAEVQAPEKDSQSFRVWFDDFATADKLDQVRKLRIEDVTDNFVWMKLPPWHEWGDLTAGLHTLHFGCGAAGTRLRAVKIDSGRAAFAPQIDEAPKKISFQPG